MAQLDVHNVSISIPYGAGTHTILAGTTKHMAFALPGTALAGGITLTKVSYSSNVAIAAGSAPCFNLITLTTAGVVVATVGANGSAALTAGTPVAGTISTYWLPGTLGYLAVEMGNDPWVGTANVRADIQYVMGRGNS